MASQQDLVVAMIKILAEMGHSDLNGEMGPDSVMANFGLDSLSTLEFLMLVEEQTGVEITTDDFSPDLTLDGLAELIKQKLA